MEFAEELRRFRERCGGRTIQALIIPGSLQAVTAALLIGALEPRRVAFLLTPDTLDTPTGAATLLGANAAAWQCYTEDHTDTLQVYRSLRAIIEAWSDLPRAEIAVDLTGGTKPMSVGLAKAAYVLGIDTLYIESDFTPPPGPRRPLPGTQRLAPPPDPYEVFGDLEAAEATRLFNAHDYAGALRIFADLARRVPAPSGTAYDAAARLARAYTAWDAFDLRPAAETMAALVQASPPALDRKLLNLQAEALAILAEVVERASGRGRQALETLARPEDVLPILGSLLANARRREVQGRFDTAALLRYRCLELVSQHRLATYGVLTEQPEMDSLARAHPGLDAAYRAVEGRVGFRPRGLPYPNRNGSYSPIALFGGYMLLAALDDQLVKGLDLERVRDRTRARNSSILAHGYRLITAEEYAPFADVVDELLDRLFAILGRDRALWEQTYRFITLPPA